MQWRQRDCTPRPNYEWRQPRDSGVQDKEVPSPYLAITNASVDAAFNANSNVVYKPVTEKARLNGEEGPAVVHDLRCDDLFSVRLEPEFLPHVLYIKKPRKPTRMSPLLVVRRPVLYKCHEDKHASLAIAKSSVPLSMAGTHFRTRAGPRTCPLTNKRDTIRQRRRRSHERSPSNAPDITRNQCKMVPSGDDVGNTTHVGICELQPDHGVP